MTKEEYLNALDTVSAAIIDDTLYELSDYTASYSLQQLIKYKAQQN